MNRNCNSSHRFITHARYCGYNNIREFSEGLQGWRQQVSDADTEGFASAKKNASAKKKKKQTDDDDDEDVYEDIEYEGIPYLVKNPSENQPDNLYNPDEIYISIGTATIEEDEITSVKFAATPAGQEAKELHENREEIHEPEPEEEAGPEQDPEPEEEEEQEDPEPEAEAEQEEPEPEGKHQDEQQG